MNTRQNGDSEPHVEKCFPNRMVYKFFIFHKCPLTASWRVRLTQSSTKVSFCIEQPSHHFALTCLSYNHAYPHFLVPLLLPAVMALTQLSSTACSIQDQSTNCFTQIFISIWTIHIHSLLIFISIIVTRVAPDQTVSVEAYLFAQTIGYTLMEQPTHLDRPWVQKTGNRNSLTPSNSGQNFILKNHQNGKTASNAGYQ